MLTNYFGDMSYFNEDKVYVTEFMYESLIDLQLLIKY